MLRRYAVLKIQSSMGTTKEIQKLRKLKKSAKTEKQRKAIEKKIEILSNDKTVEK